MATSSNGVVVHPRASGAALQPQRRFVPRPGVRDNACVPPLIIADDITVTKGPHRILTSVALGLQEGDRIGIVGRNGGGKSTLLRSLAGLEHLDAGRITRRSGVRVELVAQGDALPAATVGAAIFGDRAEHDWAGDARARDILQGLFGGVAAPELTDGLATPTGALSGGESRRVALAAALVHNPDVLLLDEPTNHLDIAAVAWLAGHVRSRPDRSALAVVTHDRWFLDEVTQRTWEVGGQGVEAYDGGYAAYVLAKAERERISASVQARRQNLLRKELAWLRRGPPARTSKPKFRIDAATELIADEPPPRDQLSLRRVASARLGKSVLELRGVTVARAEGADPVLSDLDWGLGPGDRIGLLGRNGVGKTTLIRLLLGRDAPPHTGSVRRGKTVVPALLDQRIEVPDPGMRVLPWLQQAGERIIVTSGDDLTASQLLEQFGFAGDAVWRRLADLSGGELRRLHLLRLLLGGPNVLLLDEPTNDLDVETLTVLEDVLDRWPGTLLVVSHDRYFLERVCDDVWLMPGDGSLRHLPGGVEEYLAELAGAPSPAPAGRPAAQPRSGAALAREQRKELTRIERAMDRARAAIARLHAAMADAATDPAALVDLGRELAAAESSLAALEDQWLALAEEASH